MRVVAISILCVVSLLAAPTCVIGQEQKGTMARVGYIRSGTQETDPYREAFRRGMRDLGYVEGRNVAFVFRYYGTEVGKVSALTAELARSKVDVIAVGGVAAVRAARAVTRTVPVVMLANDPVGSELISSLTRPGDNITGIAMLSPEITGKRLELLKEFFKPARIAIVQNPDSPAHSGTVKAIEPVARALGVTLRVFEVRKAEEIGPALEIMKQWPADAAVVLDDAALIALRTPLAEQAVQRRIPLVCGYREMAQAGCLFAYSPNLATAWQRMANYVDKILKGAKAGDLPVEQPTHFELVINLKTAKTLGLAIPPALFARADEVIQ